MPPAAQAPPAAPVAQTVPVALADADADGGLGFGFSYLEFGLTYLEYNLVYVYIYIYILYIYICIYKFTHDSSVMNQPQKLRGLVVGMGDFTNKLCFR